MQQITVRLPEKLIGELDDEAENGHYDSRAERIRDILESRSDVDELQQEVDRLRRERRQILEQRTENQELVAFASERRSMLEADRRLRNLRRAAPIWRKVWWSIFGEPIDPETGERI